MFIGSTGVHVPNGISIGSAVFAGLTVVTDRQTDRPTYRPTDRQQYTVAVSEEGGPYGPLSGRLSSSMDFKIAKLVIGLGLRLASAAVAIR